jgi:SAM-dependent methyltransferase
MSSGPPSEPRTWHYGLVARWWAEFHHGGPEIEFLRPFVEAGQPALDVSCGTGRVLIPLLQAGFDIDGSDLSPDMLARCGERAEREGLAPDLYEQATHELHLPRTYRTIYVCGSFGIGGNRDHDREALGRLYDHLDPGGLLVLDHEMSYADAEGWIDTANYVELMLSVAGFEDIDLRADWTDEDPTPGTNTVVFLARKPA